MHLLHPITLLKWLGLTEDLEVAALGSGVLLGVLDRGHRVCSRLLLSDPAVCRAATPGQPIWRGCTVRVGGRPRPCAVWHARVPGWGPEL